MQRDHMLGLAAYDPGPYGFEDVISKRRYDELLTDYARAYPPQRVNAFESEQFLNPDGTYTPTPKQAFELAGLILRRDELRREQAFKTQQELETIAHKVKKNRFPDRAAPDTGRLGQGQVWAGSPEADTLYYPSPDAAQAIGELIHRRMEKADLGQRYEEMRQREKMARAQAAYAPIAKQLDKMEREPD